MKPEESRGAVPFREITRRSTWPIELLKLCTKHEAYLARNHYGKRIDLSELNEDDIYYLDEKEEGDDDFQEIFEFDRFGLPHDRLF